MDDGFTVEAQNGFSGPLSIHYTESVSGLGFPGALGGDDNGRMFIVDSGLIVEISTATPETTINTFPAPPGFISGLAFDGTNLYASDLSGNLITLDPDTGAELARVSVAGGSLIGLAAGQFGNSSLGLTLDFSIDTNDRLVQQTTLIAPDGGEVIEGQTFTISDGVNSVTFEYEDPPIGNGVSEAGRVEIRFKTPDPLSPGGFRLSNDFEIAARIRDAINSPQVQSQLLLRASLSDGTNTGNTSRSNLINLFGGAVVEQDPPFGIVDTNNEADVLRDALLAPI